MHIQSIQVIALIALIALSEKGFDNSQNREITTYLHQFCLHAINAQVMQQLAISVALTCSNLWHCAETPWC